MAEPDEGVQEELNLLNSSSNDINRLENEIDEARAKYRCTFSDASQKMASQGKELKRYIQRARQYYQLKEAAIQAQSEALRAARQYQTANGVYRAAKETISLAEQKLMDEQPAAMLSSAWQEMLNHATIRVMEAERDKTRSEEEHQRRSAVFASLETKLQFLEKKFKKSIAKSRPYFEMKAELELKLQQQKQNIDDLQNAIKSSKKQYSESLRRLESISEEIHESRRQKILLMFPREPGVGADNESMCSSISEPNLERGMLSISSPGEDTIDSDIDDTDEVFDQVHSETSSLSLSEISRELPETEKHNLPSPVNGESREVAENLNGSKQETSTDSDNCNNVDIGKNVVNQCESEEVVCLNVHESVAQKLPEVRESGSGAEQLPHCEDDSACKPDIHSRTDTCQKNSKAKGDILPERDDNPTEGSSDPEEFVKPVNVPHQELILAVPQHP